MAMMISKFNKIIKSKIVWGAFAALICIAFVGVTIPGSKSRSAARRQQAEAQLAGRLFGEDVSRLEFARAYQSVRFDYLIQYGPFRITDEVHEVISQAAWQRLAMLKKARQLNMMAAPDQIVSMIQSQPIFFNPQTGQFDPEIYAAAVQQIESISGMSPKDIENHYAEMVLLNKVSRIPVQGALVTDMEITKAFHIYQDKRTVEYTFIPRSLTGIPDVTSDDAQSYYARNMEDFRLPEKVMVQYVEFPVAEHLEGVEVTDEMIARAYEANKEQYRKPPAEEAAPDAAPEYQPLEEVKDEVAENVRNALARRAAADHADELVAALADESMTFEKAAGELGLQIIDNTPAFAMTDPVRDVDPTAPFQRAAFALENDETHYYSDPVVGRDYVYVIALVKKLDSFVPPFEAVQAEAMEAARLAATEQLYIEQAEQIHDEISAALKEGTAFSDAVAKYGLEITVTEPFDFNTPIEDEFGEQIIGAAVLCEEGRLTELIATPDEYILAYVAEKTAADEADALPAVRSELVDSLTAGKANQLLSAWQQNLLEEAEFENLLDQPENES